MASLTAICKILFGVADLNEDVVMLASLTLGKTMGVTKETVVVVTTQTGAILSGPNATFSLEPSVVLGILNVTCFSDLWGLFFVVSIEIGNGVSFGESGAIDTTGLLLLRVFSPPSRVINLFFLIVPKGFSAKTVTDCGDSSTCCLSFSHSLAVLSISFLTVDIGFTGGGSCTGV